MQKTNIISFVLGVITGGVVGGYITKKYVEYRDSRIVEEEHSEKQEREEYEEKTENYKVKSENMSGSDFDGDIFINRSTNKIDYTKYSAKPSNKNNKVEEKETRETSYDPRSEYACTEDPAIYYVPSDDVSLDHPTWEVISLYYYNGDNAFGDYDNETVEPEEIKKLIGNNFGRFYDSTEDAMYVCNTRTQKYYELLKVSGSLNVV